MSKRATNAAIKKAAYDETMKSQPKANTSKARWVRWSWDPEKDTLKQQWIPGFFPRPRIDWHREGSLDEIEARENAGQREMF